MCTCACTRACACACVLYRHLLPDWPSHETQSGNERELQKMLTGENAAQGSHTIDWLHFLLSQWNNGLCIFSTLCWNSFYFIVCIYTESPSLLRFYMMFYHLFHSSDWMVERETGWRFVFPLASVIAMAHRVEVVEEADAGRVRGLQGELEERLHVQRGWDDRRAPEESRDRPWSINASCGRDTKGKISDQSLFFIILFFVSV